jgi:hypothetical protein
MGFPEAAKPDSTASTVGGLHTERLGQQLDDHFNKRSARRQRLAAHLHACGPRPVFEALLQVGDGKPLDDVLERYGRIPVEIYHMFGANELAVDSVAVIDGRRP